MDLCVCCLTQSLPLQWTRKQEEKILKHRQTAEFKVKETLTRFLREGPNHHCKLIRFAFKFNFILSFGLSSITIIINKRVKGTITFDNRQPWAEIERKKFSFFFFISVWIWRPQPSPFLSFSFDVIISFFVCLFPHPDVDSKNGFPPFF